MKMPPQPDPELLAPCGMNCLVCYKHCDAKNPCPGCRKNNAGKPGHCRACNIKTCVLEKKQDFCWQCEAFPCVLIKRLDKSYRVRYNASLIENGENMKTSGIPAFLQEQKNRYTCCRCGGVVSLHDGWCSECGMSVI